MLNLMPNDRRLLSCGQTTWDASSQYTQYLKRLRLKKEIAHLLSALRSVLGQSFLEGVKVFIAHPVTSNVFLRTYKYNFPPPWKLSAPDAGVRAEERENLS